MKFPLFSRSFEVSEPIVLIESYCFQSDFYQNYDLKNYEKGNIIENVNGIGARMTNETLEECRTITEKTKGLSIFKYELDKFLKLDSKTRNDHVAELFEKVIVQLVKIKGVQLSTATKVLHTLYPKIIPIIDSLLQVAYRNEPMGRSTQQTEEILVSYYDNLDRSEYLDNLNLISDQLYSNKIIGLTKVRIFDILWWSYLKSDQLTQEKHISWSTIKQCCGR